MKFNNFQEVLDPNKPNPLGLYVFQSDIEHTIKIVFAFFVCWLTKDSGAAGAISLDNLMEDAATVEICRA